MIIYGPCSCHVASRDPGQIGIKPIERSVQIPSSIRFYDIDTGWTFLRDRVKLCERWEVYEDNTRIADGNGNDGKRLVSNLNVITGYLRTFLDLLDADALKPSHERNRPT